MPRLLQRLTAAFLLRRLSRDLARIATALDQQTTLLARLADRFAPMFPVEPAPADRAVLRAETGVSHVDVEDVALAEYFIARSEASTGHTPDEDEILIHLADEGTRDLDQRLAARDQELERLMESRR